LVAEKEHRATGETTLRGGVDDFDADSSAVRDLHKALNVAAAVEVVAFTATQGEDGRRNGQKAGTQINADHSQTNADALPLFSWPT
jgi:hypothetical protein